MTCFDNNFSACAGESSQSMLRGDNCMLLKSPLAIVYCYIEFKLRYLKNLKLSSIRVKELSEPIVL